MRKSLSILSTLAVVACIFSAAPSIYAAAEGDTLEYFLATLPLLVPNVYSVTLNQEFRYTDNMDKQPRKRANDTWITHTKVDGTFTRQTDKLTWGIAAGVGYEHYFHKPKSTHRKDFTYHFAPILTGGLDLDGHNFMVRFNSRMDNVQIDQSNNDIVMRFYNDVALVYDAMITGKTGVTGTVDFSDTRYDGSEYKSNECNKLGASISPFYQLSDRQRFGVNGNWKRTWYRNNEKHDDYDAVEIKAFDNYDLTARASLYTSVGAKRNFYESGSISKSANGSDKWDMTYLANLRYLIADGISTVLRVGRDSVDSHAGTARGKRLDHFVGVALDYRLTGKMVFRQGFTVTFCDEKTSDDDVQKYLYNARVEYQIRNNLSAYVGYNLDFKRYKYLDDKNYVANEFIVGATYAFR